MDNQVSISRMFDEANRYLVSFATEMNSKSLFLNSKLFFNKIHRAVFKELDSIFKVKTRDFIRVSVKVNNDGLCDVSISFKDKKAVSDMKTAVEAALAKDKNQ